MAEPVRAVLVGCCGISRAWLNAIKDASDVVVCGLVDVREEQTAKVAAEYGLAAVPRDTDLSRLLRAVKPEAVFDCTVPAAHVTVTLTALRHGCHVLGEKPLADSMAHARRMVQAAAKAGRIYAVIQNRRYQHNIRALRRFLDSGAVGRLSTLNADFYLGAHFGGFRDRMEHVLLLDMAIHSFDQARLISGADPVSVYCQEWNPPGSWYDHDASAQAIFRMTGDIVFNYRGSWCSEGLNTSWECEWRIVGDKGSVRWDGGEQFSAEVARQTGGFKSELARVPVPVDPVPGMELGHKGVIAEFVRCVRHGGTPMTVCTDNIKSLAMVFGAIASAERGRRITVRI